jgi:NodT family efflux transporter outer membrane factor (OMF) lipoprotein
MWPLARAALRMAGQGAQVRKGDLPAFGGVLSLAVALLAGGCTVGADWTRPQLWAPGSWAAARAGAVPGSASVPSRPVADPPDAAWWRIFGDDELSALESRAAAGNFSVRLAAIRFVESRAQRQMTGAGQFPSAQADGSYTREEISRKGVFGLFGGAGSGTSFTSQGGAAGGLSGRSGGIPAAPGGGPRLPPFNLWQFGFDASWELDFWGRVRREVESADASVEASAEARRNALLSVLAEVARDYVQLRGVQTQLAITRQNVTTARDTLALTQDRFHGGLTSALDVTNAAAQLHLTEAQLPSLEQQESSAVNALSLLLGEGPGALRNELGAARPVPPVPPRVPVGVPSELARRRPDIREAEAQLHAATAQIGVAVADFYPRITLDGSIGLQALHFKDLGSWAARQYGLGPSITLPIFEGGRLRATLELRKAEQQEAAITYQQTVLQAWHDVDNALTAYAAEQRRHDALDAAATEDKAALDLARQRYAQGLSGFLDVLDAQRAVLAAQLQLTDSQTSISLNLIQLYKALGGGWQVDIPEAPQRRT